MQPRWLAKIDAFCKKYLNKIHLPLIGMGLYDFLKVFFHGLGEGIFGIRAAAVSYSLFLSLFPFLIFLFALIPHLGIGVYLEDALKQLLTQVFPENQTTHASYHKQLIDSLEIFKKKDSTLLSTGIGLSILFTTNGVNALITGLNYSFHTPEKKPFFRQYLTAFMLTLILTSLFITVLYIVYQSSNLKDIIKNGQLLYIDNYSDIIAFGLAGTLIVALFFLGAILIYKLGPKTHLSFKGVIPGAILATVLFVLIFKGFTAYLAYFATYQTLYSSLGTFLAVMLWIYLNVVVLLIGFELNVALYVTRMKKESKLA